jgi:hypothetical protein
MSVLATFETGRLHRAMSAFEGNPEDICSDRVLLGLTDAVEKYPAVTGFAIEGSIFGLCPAGRRSLIGEHHDQPGRPLT